MMLRFRILTYIYALVSSWLAVVASAQTPTGAELLGAGVNFGNMLEAPNEGDWGVRFKDEYIQLVAEQGFDHIRLPVRWSAHLGPNGQIDPQFLARVHYIVSLATSEKLKVVLNVHHFDEIFTDPSGANESKLLDIWRQLSESFQDAPDNIYFEILNEPNRELGAMQWNDLFARALQLVRQIHPERWVVVGPASWNAYDQLSTLELPADDRHLIVTFHYYLPFDFTHQGATWVSPVRPLGVDWTGNESQLRELRKHFDEVAVWGREHQRPVYLGEFGSLYTADMASRARWTGAVRQAAGQREFGWCYWELASGFGILDPETNKWKTELVESLKQK